MLISVCWGVLKAKFEYFILEIFFIMARAPYMVSSNRVLGAFLYFWGGGGVAG